MAAILEPRPARFRPLSLKDIPEVVGIERRAYAQPWTQGIFIDCINMGYRCEALECDGVIQSYGIMSSGGGEAHLLNLCVRPESQHQGYGRRMLEHIIDRARGARADLLLLEVRPSNRPAISLYESAGFNEVGIRKGYYPAFVGREDAIVMARVL